jgi:hypothetical protein
MSPEQSITLVVLAIALPLVGLGFLAILRPGTFDETTGALIMRYSLPLRLICVVVGIVAPGFVVLMMVLEPPSNGPDRVTAVCMLLGFGLLGLFLLIESFTFHVIVTDGGLESYSAWRFKRIMEWSEVVSVVSLNATSYLLFTSRRGVTIRVPLWFTGLKELALFIKDHLAFPAYRGADHAIRRLLGPDYW